ncbi:TVP38/TMEM64 family protein [Salipaludibacillus sp. HK11]|uniref:TVP38/TMEM64 family protein n=1 Tax=Salipaludibacillus sp. HK11 TaxID=3394320 RepID=UPI0039FD0A46
MKRIIVIFAVVASILLVVFNWEWVIQLREDNLSYFTDELFAELGYGILFITIPLMMIQNVVTLFPILILIMIHFISFGMLGGFVFSLIGTCLGAMVCFWLTKSASEKFVQKYWNKNEEKLSYIFNLISSYGVFMIVFLRSIPVMPSNLISIAAGLSPINQRTYLWSTVLGNISMVWLLSLLSAPLWMRDNQYIPYLVGYLLFATAVAIFYFSRFYRKKVK